MDRINEIIGYLNQNDARFRYVKNNRVVYYCPNNHIHVIRIDNIDTTKNFSCKRCNMRNRIGDKEIIEYFSRYGATVYGIRGHIVSYHCANEHRYRSGIHLIDTTMDFVCNRCDTRNGHHKRYDFKVRKLIQSEGNVILNLSDKYLQNEDMMSLKCPNGHLFRMKARSFVAGLRCSYCSSTDLVEKKEVVISGKKYRLVGHNMENRSDNIFICDQNHIFCTTNAYLLDGYKCFLCQNCTKK